ncbi:MAG: pilus assembly PilX N-terminal domain-containing protein [Magnetococcales bacterium]|nr:pilus assembly PilX N-terminal domain-containing protein [Magnetococcales bacterium]
MTMKFDGSMGVIYRFGQSFIPGAMPQETGAPGGDVNSPIPNLLTATRLAETMNNAGSPKQRGSALMITITLIVIGSALASALANIMANSAVTTRNNQAGMEALFLAESGLEAARFRLAQSGRNAASSATVGIAREACGHKSSNNLPIGATTAVGRGEYAATITYVAGTTTVRPTLTLSSSGYFPSLASPRGQRNLLWREVRCTSSYAPIYSAVNSLSSVASSYIKINTRNKTRDTNEDCGATTPGCNAVDENAINIDANYTFPAFPAFADFAKLQANFPSRWVSTTTTSSNLTVNDSTTKNYGIINFNGSSKTLTFAGTPPVPTCTGYCDPTRTCIGGTGSCPAPLQFNIQQLNIGGSNATITMAPGDYFIESLWVKSGKKTPKFNIASGYSDAYSVNLHIRYSYVQDDTEINYSATTPKPSRFTLWYYGNYTGTCTGSCTALTCVGGTGTCLPNGSSNCSSGNCDYLCQGGVGTCPVPMMPPWFDDTYQLRWTDPIKINGVILGQANTNALISSGSYTLNGGLLTQGTLSIINPIAVTYVDPTVSGGDSAIMAVKRKMDNGSQVAPLNMSRGQWRENFN